MKKLLVLTLLFLTFSGSAQALDRDVKAVMITSGYGMAIGTAAGLVAWPLSGQFRGVFVGTSVGLYLGIAVGIYYIWHRHDQENPLRNPNPTIKRHRWDEGHLLIQDRRYTAYLEAENRVELNIPIIKF